MSEKLIAFVTYPRISPLDLVGPATVLRDIGSPYRIVFVAQSGATLETDTRMGVMAQRTFEEVGNPYAVLVPGAGAATPEAVRDESLLKYIRSASECAEVVGSFGPGALLLGAAGLLQGRRAATHWAYEEDLTNFGAQTLRERWVEDGKFMTAAGGSAGIDMMLALLGRLRGRRRANFTQLVIEYDPEPPFGKIERSAMQNEVRRSIRNVGTAPSLPATVIGGRHAG